jgi:hypothetical protein
MEGMVEMCECDKSNRGRKVQITFGWTYSSEKQMGIKDGDILTGKFIGFFQEGGIKEDGLFITAIIELDGGQIYTTSRLNTLKFID